uniref:Ribosomal protein/NADH dehydrogenase domain-containing protein n=2 Tax=Alexandrium monilatum TaxID=311494 RepID=A0A7S4Q5Q3_9DINO
MRRVERAILGSPMVLRSVNVVNVVGRRDNKMVEQWMTRFSPMLRYANPALVCEFRPLEAARQQVAQQPASAAEAAGAASEEAGAAGAKAEPQDGADAVDDASSAIAEAQEKEHIELHFTDGTSHSLNLSLYRWSHQIMQRIVELDTEKGLGAG